MAPFFSVFGKMAGKLSESLDTPALEIPFDHKVSYAFNREELLDSKEFIFDIDCRDVPSSWLFEIRMQNDLQFDVTTFPVSLIRVDYLDKPVDAIIEYEASDARGRVFSPASTSIRKDGMLTSNVLEGTFEGTALFPQKKKIFNYQYVSFTIRILNCHSGKTEDSEAEDSSTSVV